MAKSQQISWNQTTADRIILVSGGEDFLANRFLRSLKQSLKTKHPQLEVTELEAAEYEPGRLFELTAPSLFGEERLVIIDHLESCTDAVIEDGLAFLVDDIEDCTVVFRHSTGVRGKKLLEALRSNARVTEVSCEKIAKEADRISFATGEFRNAKRGITAPAVKALVDSFGDDVAGLAAACDQLLQDVSENIDESIVERYFSGRADVDTFRIVDAAIAGDSSNALTLLRQALEAGAEPASMVGAFAHRIRGLAKLLNNRHATASQLGMAPWALEKARRELVGWTEAGMAAVVTELASMDAASKGMDRAPHYATERFVLLLANKGLRIG